MFNMVGRDRYSTSVRIIVNNDGAAPYQILNTYPSINFVPFSTSGALLGGSQPAGNAFIDSNQILTSDSSGGPCNRFDAVATPAAQGDLLAFVSLTDIALYSQAGIFLAAYAPSTDACREPDTHDTPAATAGTVYVFNIFSEELCVSSNGGAVGSIPGWSDGSGPVPIYTPSVQPAQRVLNASQGPGNFANGNNAIELDGPEGLGRFTLWIDGDRFPLNQSLLLFIALDHWRLTTTYGVVAAEGPVSRT